MAYFTINIEQLRDGPQVLELEVAPSMLDLIDEEYTFTERVSGKLTFQLVGSDVLGNGTLHTQIEAPCMRCLDPARQGLTVKVQETWLKGEPDAPPAEDLAGDESLSRTYQGDVIELDDALREVILAELPSRLLCRPECQGICPHCGAKLNEEPCRCANTAEAAESRLPEWKRNLKNLRLDS